MEGASAVRAHLDSPLVYTLYLLAYTSVLIRMLLSGPGRIASHPRKTAGVDGQIAEIERTFTARYEW